MKMGSLAIVSMLGVVLVGAGCAGDAGGPVQRSDEGTRASEETMQFRVEEDLRNTMMDARNRVSDALAAQGGDTYEAVYDRVDDARGRLNDAIGDLERAMQGKTIDDAQVAAYQGLQAARAELDAALELGKDEYQPTIDQFRGTVERALQSVDEAFNGFGIR